MNLLANSVIDGTKDDPFIQQIIFAMLFLPQDFCTFALFACNAFPPEICMADSLLLSAVQCYLFRQAFVTNHCHSLVFNPELFFSFVLAFT